MAGERINEGFGLRLFWTWVAVCALAELLGIAAGTGWWVAMDRIDPEPVALGDKWLMLVLKSLSGLVEGAVLGGLQALVLRRIYSGFPVAAWIAVTVALALSGWAIGSSFAIFGQSPETGAAAPDFSAGQTVAMAGAFGLAVGALFGGVQALVLRRVARRPSLWVVGNMIGWALALPVIYLAASEGDATATPVELLLPGLISGVLAGLLLGVATGLVLRWMPEGDART